MVDARERAEWRRQHWTGGVVTARDEMDDVDLEWFVAVPAAERLAIVFEMWAEQTPSEHRQHEPAPRLQRSLGGVRARRS